jgi:small GTP-binding protein
MVSEPPLLKVVIVGDGTVGKTTLVRRYCEGKFHASRVATIGVDFHTQHVQLPTGRVKLSIWDMAGQERFQVVREQFYRGSRAAALVFDVTSSVTLINLRRWREEVLQAVPDQKLVVVGNKIDLERAVNTPIGQAFASYVGAAYLETSALTGEGVSHLFETLAELSVPS